VALAAGVIATRASGDGADADVSSAEDIDQQMTTGNSQLAAGALIVPAGANAAETYLQVLRQQPGRADAMNGLRRVFAGMAQLAAAEVEAGDFDALRESLQQTDLLADGLGALGDEGRQLVGDATARALEAAVIRALALGDASGVAQGLDRFAEFKLDATALQALVAQARPRTNQSALDATAVEARTARRQSALVTVGEYRRFAEATQRPPVRCRARLSPLQLLDKRDWREPSFAQSESSPVVCVSAADAEAYAAWLSAQSGAAWRLPSLAERRANNAASTLVEWTTDCVTRTSSGCARRLAFDSKLAGAATAKELARDAARGFDEVGFRLVR
jgi:hypothetical protein